MGSLGGNLRAQLVAVVAPVSDDALGLLVFEQGAGVGHVTFLRASQLHGYGVAQRVTHRVDLGATPTTRDADGLLALGGTRPGAVAVGGHAGAVDVEGFVVLAQVLAHPLPDARPQAAVIPAVEATLHRAPLAKAGGQVSPGCAGAMNPQDAFQAQAVLGLRAFAGKKRGEPRPVGVGQDLACHAHTLPLAHQHVIFSSAVTP